MPDLGDSSIFMLQMEYQSCLLVCFIHKLVWRQFFSSKWFFFNELFVVSMKLFLLQAIHQCLTMHQLLP